MPKNIYSLGEALLQPYGDVKAWSKDQKKIYDDKCKSYMEKIINTPPSQEIINFITKFDKRRS
jgi:hypothetical protein